MLALLGMGSNRRAGVGVSQREWIRKAGLLPVLMPIAVLLLFLVRSAATPQLESFRFVILGDRTGDARPGVYEQVWQEAAVEDPAFVVTAGDTIEGQHDATAQAEWQEVERILEPYRRYPLYFTPGNHDIWSAASQRLFRQHTARPLHYIRTLRAMWRTLETGLRSILNGHEGGNPGYTPRMILRVTAPASDPTTITE